ncbi:transcriptional regulator CynR [Chromobacterium haemolyticum]|uniref:Transcriptional regulator CynR n=1 Tax=Chromobacterium haemolyticum TaxID=394935 RepID=A0ABS3GRR2_9NEIS|nr:transcriptional regulator CynR [Chromobacterium haemolyticum]MBK0416537.1 transcriptional regulator CynR [Chromobacterium haemolyticum]MBO0417731.1 transcriptional regulator CynR [Chromobacterium haemolyticum]MBO0500923.1 transcriptional regulator CynR [Chromobacterium haemolyticum]
MILRHIRYLQAVVEHGNFTRAAEALHVSQPTLSQQIKQLEETVGAQLLDRGGRTVRPTDAGAAYLEYARRALRELEAARRATRDVGDLSRGSLRLAMTPTFASYLLGPLAARLRSLYPGIELCVREATLDAIELALLEDEIDAGIAFDQTRSAEIDARPLFCETLAVVVGEGHPWRRQAEAVDAEALAQTPWALLSADFATRGHIDRYFRELGLKPRIAAQANSIGAVMEIVRHSDCATILPRAITRRHPELGAVGLQTPLPARTAAVLTRKAAYRSAALRAFLPVLDALGEELEAEGGARPPAAGAG